MSEPTQDFIEAVANALQTYPTNFTFLVRAVKKKFPRATEDEIRFITTALVGDVTR
jgi:hypothetical protein